MNAKTQRRTSLILGWSFGLLGLLGIAVPFFPSVPLFMFALVFLAKAKPRFRHLRMMLKRRYPRLLRAFGEAELRAAQISRGEFIASIRGDFNKGKERRRVARLMRRRALRARLAGILMQPDLLSYLPPVDRRPTPGFIAPLKVSAPQPSPGAVAQPEPAFVPWLSSDGPRASDSIH